MKDRKLATQYARALLACLPSAESAEKGDQFLSALRRAMEQSEEFRGLMLDPAFPRSARSAVLVALAERHGMPRPVVDFFRVLVDHRRTAALASISQLFHEERERAAGILPADIASAVPLTDDLKRRAELALERATGKRIRLNLRTDPSLIGGAVTRVGSVVYDGSLRTRLDRLRERMVQE